MPTWLFCTLEPLAKVDTIPFHSDTFHTSLQQQVWMVHVRKWLSEDLVSQTTKPAAIILAHQGEHVTPWDTAAGRARH